MRVLALGRRQVRGIGVEILTALAAVMLRVGQRDISRTPRDKLPDIVQRAGAHSIAITALATTGARPMLAVATVLHYTWRGQIFWTGDPFCGIWTVRSGTEHSRTLLGQGLPAKKLRQMPKKVMVSSR
jgi:uncharacterized protein YbbK (DUF523 family)